MSKQTLIIIGVFIIGLGAISMLTMQPLLVRLVFGLPCAVLGGAALFGGLAKPGNRREA